MRLNDDQQIGQILVFSVSTDGIDNTPDAIDGNANDEVEDAGLWEPCETLYNPKEFAPAVLATARAREFQQLTEFGAYEWIEKDKAVGGKWITSRWEDGTLRSRWVLREFASISGEGAFFAPTPSTTATTLLHVWALRNAYTVRYVDVTTAFLHAPETQNVFTDPPAGYARPAWLGVCFAR